MEIVDRLANTGGDFEQHLSRYAAALDELTGEDAGYASVREVLEALLARDGLQRALGEDAALSPEDASAIYALDHVLADAGPRLVRDVDLAQMRKSRQPPERYWWWFLERDPFRPRGRLWWLWQLLTVLCLTASVALLVVIASRFLVGGLDTLGALLVAFQATFTLLAAGTAFTRAGRAALDSLLQRLGVPESRAGQVEALLTGLLLAIVVSVTLSLPAIARYYNNRGEELYRDGRLAGARRSFEQAVRLRPDYTEAHYNLAIIYEDLFELEMARTSYRIAAEGGLDAAWNNLARLYLVVEPRRPERAAALLLEGLDVVQDEPVRYDMLKNLGWARLEQGRYEEARTHLKQALALRDDAAPAYCLLARVYEGDDESEIAEEAAPMWENCLRYADPNNPDEDQWLAMARARLAE